MSVPVTLILFVSQDQFRQGLVTICLKTQLGYLWGTLFRDGFSIETLI